MNSFACFLIAAMCAVSTVSRPFNDNDWLTATMKAEDKQQDSRESEFLLLKPDGQPHNLQVGQCSQEEMLLHQETIIVNNDGNSRVAGDIRVNVEAPVNITCVKVFDQHGNSSGAYPSFEAGGVGHNFLVLGFNTAQGYGFNFLVQVFGHSL